MGRSLIVILLMLGGTSACGADSHQAVYGGAFGPGDHDVTIVHRGRERYYVAHLPPQAEGERRLPVVLSFHGGGGTARNQMEWTSLSTLADAEGFIAVFPDGTGNPRLGRRLLTWNAGACCGPAKRNKVDDVGFVTALLEDLASRTSVDHTRVYATGMSNGAMMSYRLAQDISTRLAAIAPVAGALAAEPRSEVPVPILHLHSVDDPRALYEGGLGPPFPFTRARVEHPAVESVVGAWARRNGCSDQPVPVEEIRGANGHGATRLEYPGCADGAEVVLWKLTGAGHVWPGAPPHRPFVQRLLGAPTEVIDANELIWEFFRRHERPDAPPLVRPGQPPKGNAVPLSEAIEQAPMELSFDRSRLVARVGAAGTAELADLSGDYSERTAGLSGSWCLKSLGRLRPDRSSFFRLQAQVNASSLSPELTILHRDPQIFKVAAGLTGLYLSPGMNLFGVYVGGRLAEEDTTADSPEVTPVALGFGSHRLSDGLTMLYGGSFTYLFGRGLALPLVGAWWRPRDGWDLAAILPLFAQASYRASPKWQLGWVLAAAGDRYRLSNEDQFPVRAETLQMQLRGVRTGLFAKHRLTRDAGLRLDLGTTFARSLTILDEEDAVVESDIDPAGYFLASLDYSWGGM